MKKLKELEEKLNLMIWKDNFKETCQELDKTDSLNLLGCRKENLARVLSTIKNLGLKQTEIALFEIGSGAKIMYEKFWEAEDGYFNSNVFNFFIKNPLSLEYYGFDSMLSKYCLEKVKQNYGFFEDIKTIEKQLLFEIEEIKERTKPIIPKNKIPVIFSNLVIGFNKKDEDNVKGSRGNPAFWKIPGIQIHQYFKRDLIKRARGYSEEKNKSEIENILNEIKQFKPEKFDLEILKLFKEAYNIKTQVVSTDLGDTKNSGNYSNPDIYSIWINL